MNYSLYISKHLYSIVKSCNDETVSTFLDSHEIALLDYFGIAYQKDKNTEYNYLIKPNDLKSLFSNT